MQECPQVVSAIDPSIWKEEAASFTCQDQAIDMLKGGKEREGLSRNLGKWE